MSWRMRIFYAASAVTWLVCVMIYSQTGWSPWAWALMIGWLGVTGISFWLEWWDHDQWLRRWLTRRAIIRALEAEGHHKERAEAMYEQWDRGRWVGR